MIIPPLALVPLALAVVLLAWWRPRWALMLPLVLHAAYQLRARVTLGQFSFPITVLELLVLIAVGVGIVLWGRELLRALSALPRAVLLLAFLFLCAATVSAAVAPHPRTAWGHWKAFIVEPMLYAVVLLPLLRDDRGRRAIVAALLFGGMIAAVLSLGASASCLLPPASCPLTPDFSRLRGIYDVPNSLALVVAPLTAFAAVLAVSAAAPSLRRLARWSFLLFLPTLLLAQSIAGILAAAAATLLSLWHARETLPYPVASQRRGIRRAVLASGIFSFLVGGVLFLYGTGKLAHALGERSPLQARLQIWSVSLALVRDHPLLGTGLGTFEPAYQEKLRNLLASSTALPPPLEWLVRDPHNILLSFWLNTGLLGLLSMAGLVLWSFRRSLPPPSSSLLQAAQAALAAALLFGLVDVPYLKNDLAIFWWVFISAAVWQESS